MKSMKAVWFYELYEMFCRYFRNIEPFMIGACECLWCLGRLYLRHGWLWWDDDTNVKI